MVILGNIKMFVALYIILRFFDNISLPSRRSTLVIVILESPADAFKWRFKPATC